MSTPTGSPVDPLRFPGSPTTRPGRPQTVMSEHPQAGRRLAEGTRLLHVGLAGTGAAGLAPALRARVEQLAEHGTLAPAAGPGSVRGLVAATGIDATGIDATAIARDLKQAGDVQRVVLSDETLAVATDQQVEALHGLLGPRTHVLVSLGGPARQLPAMWQRRLLEGETAPLAAWAAGVLDDPSTFPFGGLEGGAVVARWCTAVGAENVTVVVHDPADPARLPTVVEELLALPAGLLPVEPGETVLTAAEAAVVADVWARRAAEPEPAPAGLTAALLDAARTRALSDADPGRDVGPLHLDAAVAHRAQELGRAVAASVRAAGAHVVGDLDALAAGPAQDGGVPSGADPAAELGLENAAALLHGAFLGGRQAVRAAELRGQDRPSAVRVRALPVGTRILHVGAPVTGAVVAQEAFAATRGEQAPAARRAVAYPGTGRAHDALADAATRPAGDGPSPRDVVDRWSAATPAGTTTVLSGERLALLDGVQAQTVVDALRASGDPVHVVVTLRSVPEMLLAAWQHHVINGGVQTLESWLRHALDDDVVVRMGGADAFREDDGSNLVGRWAAAVGTDAVTVVVERAQGRDTLVVLASLAGIPPRALPPGPVARALTAPETEMFRSFNATLPYRGTVPADQRRRYLHGGAVAALQASPAPDEVAVELPDWSVARAESAGSRLAEQVREQVAERGVAVIGPLDALSAVPAAGTGSAEGLHRSSVETALLGIFDRAVRLPAPAPVVPPAPAPVTTATAPLSPVRLVDLPGRALLGELRRRVLRRGARPGEGGRA
jgi:hypothetical protein